jgi:predicted transcriptional regulator of viral defense system
MQQKLYHVCSICCMETRDAMKVLGGFTTDQWGLVTSAQAIRAEVDRTTLTRLVDAGLLDHVRRGVYAVRAAPEDPLREIRAAWLQLNPSVPAWRRPLLDPDGGVASHNTATQIHQLGDLLTGKLQFIVPRRRTSRHPDIGLRQLPLETGDVTKAEGLPVTTVERTVADLLSDRIDAGHIGDIVYQALWRRLVDQVSLTARIKRYAHFYGIRGHDGAALLQHLLDQAGRQVPQGLS